MQPYLRISLALPLLDGQSRRTNFLHPSGSNNTPTGVAALLQNTTGFYNTATGVSALYANTGGHDNTA
jgi:hypothetical protein